MNPRPPGDRSLADRQGLIPFSSAVFFALALANGNKLSVSLGGRLHFHNEGKVEILYIFTPTDATLALDL